MEDHEKDFYQNMRHQIREWVGSKAGKGNKFSEYLLFAPDLFHLLCKLTFDDRISTKDKAKFGAATVYFVSPVDLIPEGLIGPIGYLDDVAIAAYVLNQYINKNDETVVREHWAGDEDVLDVIKTILAVADEMIGAGMWRNLKGMFNRV